MTEAVYVPALGATISMTAILVAGVLASLLLIWADNHTDHGDAH